MKRFLAAFAAVFAVALAAVVTEALSNGDSIQFQYTLTVTAGG